MMVPDMCSRTIQLLYLSSIYLFLLVPHGGSVSFNFNFSDPNTVNEHIKLESDASYDREKIDLTNNFYSTGRATYNQPVPLWDKDTGEVTNFTTQFSFLIQNTTPDYADGLAFFLSSYPSQIPPDSYGKALGLFSAKTLMNASANQVVAVEFDTLLNSDIDPNSTDLTDCHIGIDVNKINSTSYKLIPNDRFIGTRMIAEIKYNSSIQLLSLSLWHEANSTIQFSLNATVDIRKLPPNASVGFSAGTGSSIETHQIFWWSFNSTLGTKTRDKNKINVPLISGIVMCTFIMFIVVGIFIYHLRKRRAIKKIREIEVIGDESIDYEFEKRRGPKRFPYNELVDATNGFGENEKLGEGGFGSVYRGILRDENVHVAVKRVSKDSKQGKKEYISEVMIISQLRHRNLVQLIGWCHDHGEFLLVYELMHKGSLDKHLYSKESFLT